MNLETMLTKCERLQWSLSDIDWDGPGRERVSAEQVRELRGFMADLVWIERLGSMVFAAMAGQARDQTLAAILRSFAADEQRHADAELGLMVRWGMLPAGGTPELNPNARRALRFLEKHAHEVPLSVFAAVLPMFEIALDGALLQFLTGYVDDPVCQTVFERVNADEARHLAIDFYMLEALGRESAAQNAFELLRTVSRPAVVELVVLGYLPLLERALQRLGALGLDLRDLRSCMLKFRQLGRENPQTMRHLSYRVARFHAAMFAAPSSHPYHRLGRALVRATDVLEAARSGTLS